MTRRQIAALLVAVALVAGLATTAANVAWFVYAPPLAAALPPTGTAALLLFPSTTPTLSPTVMSTATHTVPPPPPATAPPTQTAIRNPTAVSIYQTQQAATLTRQAAGCAAIEQVYQRYGRTYDRQQDPELTVVEVVLMQGGNPQIHSTINDRAYDLIRQNARACQGR